MLGAKTDAAAQFDGREIDLELCSARGLKKADTFGLADPYVKIRWNNKVVGKTAVVRNTLTPVWEQGFVLSVPGHMAAEQCSLYLEVGAPCPYLFVPPYSSFSASPSHLPPPQPLHPTLTLTPHPFNTYPHTRHPSPAKVWDADSFGGGSFLGALTLSGPPLVALLEASRGLPKWFPLTFSEYLPTHIQSLVQGEVEVRMGYKGSAEGLGLGLSKLVFRAHGASGLARADGIFGLSDPYALVKVSVRGCVCMDCVCACVLVLVCAFGSCLSVCLDTVLFTLYASI